MIHFFLNHLRQFRRKETGTASVEFVILFPLFIGIFISSIEVSVATLRNVMLERALDLNVRALRLGFDATPTHDELKADICEDALIVPNCTDVIQIQLSRVSTDTWQPLGTQPQCIDRTEEDLEPVIDFTGGLPNDLMLVRLCVIFDPLLPAARMAAQMPLDASGGYGLVATSAFVVEPP